MLAWECETKWASTHRPSVQHYSTTAHWSLGNQEVWDITKGSSAGVSQLRQTTFSVCRACGRSAAARTQVPAPPAQCQTARLGQAQQQHQPCPRGGLLQGRPARAHAALHAGLPPAQQGCAAAALRAASAAALRLQRGRCCRPLHGAQPGRPRGQRRHGRPETAGPGGRLACMRLGAPSAGARPRVFGGMT